LDLFVFEKNMTQMPSKQETSHILVVDDEEITRAFVSDVLRDQKYEVALASSGEEGLRLLSLTPFDLVLVDLFLPGMDGMSMIRQARADGVESPFIIITGYGSVESAIEALHEGVADYVLKPLKVNELLMVVERALKHWRVLRENLDLRESMALYEVVRAIAASGDLDEILGLIVQALKRKLNAEQVIAFIQVEEGGLLPAAGTKNTPPDMALFQFAQTVLDSPEVVVHPLEQGVRIGLRLQAQNRAVGVLVADLAELPHGGQRRAWDLLSGMAGIAIHNAQLLATLEKNLHHIEEQQAQLIQSSKLSIIGEMAASIAHEIRNPLSAITLGCELLQVEAEEQTGQSQTEAKALETILTASRRLGELVENLVGFSRKQGPVKGPVDVGQLLTKTKSLVRYHLAKYHVQWVEDLAGDGRPIRGNEGQLQQVLLNLVLNACDAMPDGGTLVFATAPAELDGQGPALALTIRDTGAGIPPEDLKQIFEPFYTTKGNRGTGLGLTISRNIVRDHQGTLDVESEVGKGTAFTVTLPLFIENQPGSKKQGETHPGGKGV